MEGFRILRFVRGGSLLEIKFSVMPICPLVLLLPYYWRSLLPLRINYLFTEESSVSCVAYCINRKSKLTSYLNKSHAKERWVKARLTVTMMYTFQHFAVFMRLEQGPHITESILNHKAIYLNMSGRCSELSSSIPNQWKSEHSFGIFLFHCTSTKSYQLSSTLHWLP